MSPPLGYGDYPQTVEEGVTLSAYVNEVTAYLQFVFEQLEARTEDRIMGDPFYESHLSEKQIDDAIAALDAYYDSELTKYPDYHKNRSGANARTELSRLGPAARRSVVECLQRIRVKHGT